MKDYARQFEEVVIETHSIVVDERQKKAVVHGTHAGTYVEELGDEKRISVTVQFLNMSESGEKAERIVRFSDTAVPGQHAAEIVA